MVTTSFPPQIEQQRSTRESILTYSNFMEPRLAFIDRRRAGPFTRTCSSPFHTVKIASIAICADLMSPTQSKVGSSTKIRLFIDRPLNRMTGSTFGSWIIRSSGRPADNKESLKILRIELLFYMLMTGIPLFKARHRPIVLPLIFAQLDLHYGFYRRCFRSSRLKRVH